MPSRILSPCELTAARRAYEAGASFRDLAAEHGMSHATMRLMLRAVGVTSRPVGWPHRQKAQPAEQPPPRPAVEIAPDARGKLRIPMRSPAERRLRRWTPAERRAIEVEISAGRVARVRRGATGLPERRTVREATAAGISFHQALQRLRAA